MSTHGYSEELLVEMPAFELFAELGWETLSALEEVFGSGDPLGREMSGEVVLLARLQAALLKLNPTLPSEAISAAIEELTRDRSVMDLAAANRELYGLLKNGVPVSVVEKQDTGKGIVSPPPPSLWRAGRPSPPEQERQSLVAV